MRIRIVRAEPACAVRDGSDVLFTGDTATLTTSSLKHHGACDGGAGSDPTPAVQPVCQEKQLQCITARTFRREFPVLLDIPTPADTAWTALLGFTCQRSAVRYRPRPPVLFHFRSTLFAGGEADPPLCRE